MPVHPVPVRQPSIERSRQLRWERVMALRESKDVLVVDDDSGIRHLLCVALIRQALSVDVAVDGSDALDRLKEKNYTVLVLDLMMPRVDGFGVLAALNDGGIAKENEPVVLVMTAFDARHDLPIMAETVHAIVRKPFDLPEMVDLVAGCVRTKRNHASPSAD